MARFSHIISAIDAHTAGEPTRIVLTGLPPILGDTMAAKKRYMRERLDHFRTLLMQGKRPTEPPTADTRKSSCSDLF